MREDAPGPARMGLAVILVAMIAVLTWTAFSSLSRPRGVDERTAALASQVRDLEALAHRPMQATAYPPRAICSGTADKDIEALRRGLASAAKPFSLSLEQVDISPVAAGEGSLRRIAPMRVSFSTEGRYDAVVALLNQLAGSQPQLFVDALDLTSHTSTVNLKLSGKVFCWTAGAH